MFAGNTDNEWEKLGRRDPFYGVLSHEKYHMTNINEDSVEEFFGTGKAYIDLIMDTIRKYVDPDFKPLTALDFGCGVGRVLVHLARSFKYVVGVDVSDSMLSHAKRACEQRKIENVAFIKGNDQLSEVKGSFDFIHSFIVFQHIPTRRGEMLFGNLIRRLSAGGIGAIHLTYSSKLSIKAKVITWIRNNIPYVHNLVNLSKRRDLNFPSTQMNRYDLNNIFRILQEAGCHRVHVLFTDHGYYGVVILFQKNATISAASALSQT